jgi:3'(2'),5'-bisphosphate nucleotidase
LRPDHVRIVRDGKPHEVSVKDKEPSKVQAIDPCAAAEIFASITLEAGAAVMAIYAAGGSARRKNDGSPVTDADEAAEAIILVRLASQFPGLPVVAEEAVSKGGTPSAAPAFILVDPVDGTREFLSRNGEFTINIALIVDSMPRAGAVFAPALGKLWLGAYGASACDAMPGSGLPPPSLRRAILSRPAAGEGLTAIVSRSHADPATEAFLAGLPLRERQTAGSSLKFCAVAEGKADVYPRFGPTMEWDTAAGDAILRAAGGIVADPQGQPLRYGKAAAQFANGPFIAWGDPKAAATNRCKPAETSSGEATKDSP